MYEEIGSECLRTWYPDLSPMEINSILARQDFDEIEGYIGAKDSIETCTRALRHELEHYGIRLYDGFLAAVLYAEDPESEAVELRDLAERSELTGDFKGRIAIKLLSAVHDRWVATSTSKFFDESRHNKQYMFMPLELIGLEEATKDFIFVEPILTLIGLNPTMEELRSAYQSSQKAYLQLWNIRDAIGLWEHVSHSNYRPLNPRIIDTLKIDVSSVKNIVGSIMNRSPDLF